MRLKLYSFVHLLRAGRGHDQRDRSAHLVYGLRVSRKSYAGENREDRDGRIG